MSLPRERTNIGSRHVVQCRKPKEYHMAYKDPERGREYQRAYRQANPDKYREYARKWREGNREAIIVKRAAAAPALSSKAKVRHAKRRAQIVELLGNSCCQCGFPDPRALQIDHPNGGGLAERQRGWRYLFNQVEEAPSNYQLLCANCNTIAAIERGEHSRKY